MGRIAGVILAGGASPRMGGGDKSLCLVAGRPILAHVIERFSSQVDALALNANGDATRFASFNLPVLPDPLRDLGPLGGVLAGLRWARDQECTYLVTVACDTPFFPRNLVERLSQCLSSRAIVQSRSRDRIHPTFALWPVCLHGDLETFLQRNGASSMRAYAGTHQQCSIVDFPDIAALDPFFNINTMDELEMAERMAGTLEK